jgi:hypothetical protein
MGIGDKVIVADYGTKVAGIILDTRPYKDFPGLAAQEGTMYKVQLTGWFGNTTWLPESKLQAVLEFILEIP